MIITRKSHEYPNTLNGLRHIGIIEELSSCINFLETIEKHISEQQDILRKRCNEEKNELKSDIEGQELEWYFDSLWNDWGFSFQKILCESLFLFQYSICEKAAGPNTIEDLSHDNEIYIFKVVRNMIAHNGGKLKGRAKDKSDMDTVRKYIKKTRGISLDNNDYIKISKELCVHVNQAIKSYLLDVWSNGVK